MYFHVSLFEWEDAKKNKLQVVHIAKSLSTWSTCDVPAITLSLSRRRSSRGRMYHTEKHYYPPRRMSGEGSVELNEREIFV